MPKVVQINRCPLCQELPALSRKHAGQEHGGRLEWLMVACQCDLAAAPVHCYEPDAEQVAIDKWNSVVLDIESVME